ncbi:MAG TPA: T9SS type A sorting domain-containing protein, partial [Saprospiraceae bacterium]|nr:T9SS type A sorting domain-containing protein [Saprospiraceae bacterium]
GSGFAAGDAGGAQTSISGDDNRIEVTATELNYVQNVTSPTAVNVNMAPAVTLSANDENLNRDLDFSGVVSITSTGTLVGAPLMVNAVNGLATFATINHSALGTSLYITASSGSMSALSNSFDIIITSSSTDYFRSKQTGNWVSASSWESSADGITWQDATLSPTAASAGIQIRTGHNITKYSGQVDADQMIIDFGGRFTLDGGNFDLIGDIPDYDLIINGTFENISGNLNLTQSPTIYVSSTGVYQHNRNAGTVITATWDSGSTCEITGITATTPNGLGQSFSNFTWNSTVQTNTVNLVGSLTTVNGNFWNKNTNGNVLRLGNVPYTLTVMGNFTNDAPLELGKESYDLCIIKIKGNLSSSALFSTQDPTNVGKVVMNGTGQQTINVPAGFTDKVALEIDNTFAGVGVSLTDNFNSTDKLILTNGKLALGNYNLYVLSTITGGTATNYVVTDGTGRLIRTLSSVGPHKFPVGSTASYQPAELTFVSAPTSNIAAGFISADPGYSGLPLMETDAIDQIGRTGYWELNSAITQNYTAVFTANNFPDVINYSKLHLLKRDLPGGWFLDGTHILATGSNASATVSRSGMSGFSQFAIGGENGVALPVRFISFTGKTLPFGNQLNWMVADEVNNKGFEIERSTSVGDFRTIGFVASQTDVSIRTNSYHYTDVTTAAQGNFYRLKQIDVNGGYAYSNIIFLKDVDSKIVVYPTLVTDMLTVSGAISGDQGVIYDAQGMQVERFEISGSETKVDLSRLPSGTYIIHINGSRSESFRVNKY